MEKMNIKLVLFLPAIHSALHSLNLNAIVNVFHPRGFTSNRIAADHRLKSFDSTLVKISINLTFLKFVVIAYNCIICILSFIFCVKFFLLSFSGICRVHVGETKFEQGLRMKTGC